MGIAKDTVAAEKGADDKPAGSDAADRGMAALTALFEEVRTQKTPIIVARVVADIDAIVKPVRFDGWQRSSAGERDVKKALRLALFNYKLHSDSELFERAYGYIKQYY
jgi:type I restriction enzyme R subunit